MSFNFFIFRYAKHFTHIYICTEAYKLHRILQSTRLDSNMILKKSRDSTEILKKNMCDSYKILKYFLLDSSGIQKYIFEILYEF